MTEHDRQIGGIILCGGRGRRMGADKTHLRFGDELLLQRMVRIVNEAVQPVVVAGRQGQALPPLPDGVSIVHDEMPDAGPLAGVSAGLRALDGRCHAAFVAACDYPLLTPGVIRGIIGALGAYPAVVVRDARHVHPLLGVYRLFTRTVLETLLTRRQLRAERFARECQARVITVSELSDADPTGRFLRNVNDPDEYQRIVRELGPGDSPPPIATR